MRGVARLIRETPAQRTVELKIVRDGVPRVLSAQLETASHQFEFNMPEIHIPPINIPELPEWLGHRARLGISADNLTPQLAQYFGVKQGKGVLVSEVNKGGPADKAGLKAGDVIFEVDRKAVGNVEELADALDDKYSDGAQKVRLTIVRDHHEQTVEAEFNRSQPERYGTSAAQPWQIDWQRQLQEDMHSLQNELKHMQTFRLTVLRNNEI